MARLTLSMLSNSQRLASLFVVARLRSFACLARFLGPEVTGGGSFTHAIRRRRHGRAAMEHTRPGFPGAFALGMDLPMDAESPNVFQTARACNGAVQFHSQSEKVVRHSSRSIRIQSLIEWLSIPRSTAYMFGLHQCSHPRVWTARRGAVFAAVAADWRRPDRTADASRSSRKRGQARGSAAVAMSAIGTMTSTQSVRLGRTNLSVFGLRPQEENITGVALRVAVHRKIGSAPSSQERMRCAAGRSYDWNIAWFGPIGRCGSCKFRAA